jgi:3-oxoacyl-[acyl-carrier protein] reductase
LSNAHICTERYKILPVRSSWTKTTPESQPKNHMSKLTGKVAVVTGASKGIGASIAKELAAQGAAVVVNYASSREGADKTVAEIAKAGGKAVAVQGDVSKQADIVKLFAETQSAFGRVDVLVNNAGVYAFAPLEEVTTESFNKHFNLNVLGLLLTTQEAVKHFGDKGGVVINISSVVATLGIPGSVVYNATKGAVNTITTTLAKELGPKKIRVVGVGPGLVETEGTTGAGFIDSDFHKKLVAETPVGRTGQPKDIGSLVAFLASDDAAWISAETYYVSGGNR